MTALEEMGIVMRAVPGPRAGVREVADWYSLKAGLLEHLAVDTAGAEAERMRAQAARARQHAAELLSLCQNRVGGLAASNAS
jgi:hypothetical protein